MIEWLESIDVNVLISAIIGFVTINLGTIIAQVISNVKLKVRNFNAENALNLVKQECEARIAAAQTIIANQLELLERKIENKIEVERQKEADRLASEGTQITNNILAARASLSIDQVLGE